MGTVVLHPDSCDSGATDWHYPQKWVGRVWGEASFCHLMFLDPFIFVLASVVAMVLGSIPC